MKHIVVGTAGHIDHGKSALVQALTGTDPDRLKEEKARGITIDLGFAHWRAGDLNVAFVDVPGHERFVKNMLAGAGGIDAVLLVVAADESVMPQTREHLEICRLLQVPTGLVAMTKRDLVDEETLELVRLEIVELVRGSFLDGRPILPVSARTGAGLGGLKQALEAMGQDLPPRGESGPARLPIDRVFSMKGFGTVVTGTLVSGRLTPDQDVVLLPKRRSVKIRGIQVHGAKHTAAHAGQRVALNLSDVEVNDVARGDSLVVPNAFAPSRIVDVALETIAAAVPLRHGARVRFHQGTAELLGRFSLAAVAGANAEMQRSAEVPPGRIAYGRLRLEGPGVVARGDRFILRAYSPTITIAGGVVLDPQPPRTGVRTPAGLARFAALRIAMPDPAFRYFIEESGVAGVTVNSLAQRTGLAHADVAATARQLERDGAATVADDRVVSMDAVRALERDVLAQLGRYHGAQPLSDGMPREELRERVFSRSSPAVFDVLVDRLRAAGRIAGSDRVALAGHRLSLSPDEERARAAVERTLQAAGLKPPEPSQIAATAGVDRELAERMIALLVRQRVLVKLDTLVFHQEALRRLKDDVTALKSGANEPARLDVGAFKERYGITRKFAIPLLEYLDRERVTRRMGETRVVI